MKFTGTGLEGVWVIEPEPLEDERGYFARTVCLRELFRKRISMRIVQCNISYNIKKGTVRGLHFQKEPYEEDKLVSCIRGSIHDVIMNIKSGQSFSIVLSADNQKTLYIPKGYAHGFQSLEDDTIIYYQMGEYYNESAASKIGWNDWPLPISFISEKDGEP